MNSPMLVLVLKGLGKASQYRTALRPAFKGSGLFIATKALDVGLLKSSFTQRIIML